MFRTLQIAVSSVASALALMLLAGCSSGGEAKNEVAAETNLANTADASNVVANSEGEAANSSEAAEPEPMPAEEAAVAPKAQPRSIPKAMKAEPRAQPAPEPKAEPTAPAPTCLPEHRAAGHC